MKTNFLSAIAERPIVADGAMGTQLFARGVDPSACADHVTLSDPDLVRAVHRGYLAAGAEIVERNNFV